MSAQIEQESRNADSGMLKQYRDQESTVLRRMQSRNWLSIACDNALLGLKFCFDKFADGTATVMAGILTPKQARSLSIYATAFLVAVLMLIFCSQINMYCFRSVARNDSASAPKSGADDSMLSNNQKNKVL